MNSLDFSQVTKSTQLVDDRGRLKRFPSRHDYVSFLEAQGLVADDADFQRQEELVKAVYLDWLKRGQAGCIFAQLFGRLRNRKGLRTEVILTNGEQSSAEIANKIEALVTDSLDSAGVDAISVLLPGIRDVEALTHLLVSLSGLGEVGVGARNAMAKHYGDGRPSTLLLRGHLGGNPRARSFPVLATHTAVAHHQP